jgi:hypothetical protein
MCRKVGLLGGVKGVDWTEQLGANRIIWQHSIYKSNINEKNCSSSHFPSSKSRCSGIGKNQARAGTLALPSSTHTQPAPLYFIRFNEATFFHPSLCIYIHTHTHTLLYLHFLIFLALNKISFAFQFVLGATTVLYSAWNSTKTECFRNLIRKEILTSRSVHTEATMFIAQHSQAREGVESTILEAAVCKIMEVVLLYTRNSRSNRTKK